MSESLHPLRRELVALTRLAAPIAVSQLGWNLMGAVDVAMVGNYTPSETAAAPSTEVAMAAASLGNAYVMAVQMPLAGMLMALDPLVAQAYGANDQEAVARHVRRGLLLSCALAVPLVALLFFAEPALHLLRQREDVIPLAAAYVRAATLGSVGLLFFMAARQVLQAIGVVWPLLVTVLVANAANIGFNQLLVHGRGGFPELGAEGSGYATSASRVLMCVLLVVLGARVLWPYFRHRVVGVVRPAALWRLLCIGAPIGVQVALEVWLFLAVTFLMGGLGTVEIDGNQVALQLAALAFMVPLSIGAAASTRVGQALGRNDLVATRRAAGTALVLGVAVMAVSASAFLAFPEELARCFTHEPEVIALATLLLPVAAAFQLFDGAQVVAQGVLRGVADTKVPAVINLLGYWGLALPMALLLTFRLDAGPQGLWWGLTVGLGSVAILLLLRIRSVFRRLQPLSDLRD